MKYIDAYKLKAQIDWLYYNEAEKDESILAADAYKNALDAVEKLIDSLQQEQPELPQIERAEDYYHKGVYEGLSQGRADALKILDEFMKKQANPVIVIKQQEQPFLPDNLDDAANSYASKTECAVVACRGFKAGAEWMTKQGAIKYWMAKDKDDSLLISNYKPYKRRSGYLDTDSFKWIDVSPALSRELFPDIKLEDSPVEVIVQIRKNKG